MIFKTLNGDLTVFNKTLISTKDHLKALQTVNATVYNKNGAFNLQGLLVNSSQSVSTFTKLNNAFKAYNGNLSKSTQLQNAYVQAVGKQNITLGNYLAGLNGAKASMGGYVKSLVAAKAASIGLQAASIALNTAISMGITLAISALISAITKWVNKEKEAREEAIENAKAAKEESNNLSELLNKYNQLSKEVKSNQGVKEDLLSVQSDLLEALGIEASQIDTLIEKYGDLDSAINQITLDSLRDAQGDLMVAVDAYEKELINVGKGYAHWYSFTDRNMLSAGSDSVKLFNILEKAGIISSGSYGDGGGSLILTGNDKTVEGILENYQKLKDAQEALNTAIDIGEVTMEEMISNSLYKSINARLDELKNAVDNYDLGIDDINETMAQQQILKSLAEQSSIPETKEEFEAFQQSMINTAIASTKFKGSQDDIRDSIINVLSVMPEFEKYFEELNDIQSSTSNIENPISLSISDTIDQLNTQLKPAFDSLKSAYQDIFTTDKEGNELFFLNSVNTDMLYSIQDTISELNKIEGVSIDLSSYENLAKVLGNPGSNADDVKNSFNGLASSIIDGVSVTKGFNDQTKNLCAQLLKEMGIINADQIVLEKLNQSKIQQKAASIDFSDATADEIKNLTAYGEELGFTNQQVYGLYLQQLLVNNDPLQTKSSILQLIGLCQAGSETADTLVDLYDIMDAISKGRQKLANGELTAAQAEVTKSEIEKLQKEMSDKVNNMISSNTEIDWDGADDSKPPSSSSPEKDTRLEEYRQKLEELQTMLDQELINEKEFYDQSDALLNDYLKDTPAHMQKYADEISNAEKTLRWNWIGSFGYEKAQLEKDLSDSTLVQWQYYEQLSELAKKYYNTEGASYGKFADEYEEITREIKEGQWGSP